MPTKAKAAKKPRRLTKEGKPFKKNSPPSYSTAIRKVKKQVHPALKINSKAMKVLNSLVMDLQDRMMGEANNLVKMGKKKHMNASDISTASKLLLTGELSKHACSEGDKAVAKYKAWQPEK